MVRLIVLSAPKKRAVSKKFNSKMNHSTTDFPQEKANEGDESAYITKIIITFDCVPNLHMKDII